MSRSRSYCSRCGTKVYRDKTYHFVIPKVVSFRVCEGCYTQWSKDKIVGLVYCRGQLTMDAFLKIEKKGGENV